MEELCARHRKEQRDLQSRITQKRKSATKKTRKGVNEECDRLEVELKQKHEAELAALTGTLTDGIDKQLPADDLHIVNTDGRAPADGDSVSDGAQEQPVSLPSPDSGEAIVPSQMRKRNRQKDRLARRAAEQEELAKQAEQEALSLPDLKQQEREKMLAHMKERGLQEKEIKADGHCLYSAVADQLEQLGMQLGNASGHKPEFTYRTVRAKAAEYIEKHPDDFVPFLEEPLPGYLHKVRVTGEWGGQLELMALAKSYGVEIDVLQSDGRVEKIEPERPNKEKIVWLGYYKHGFGLGEHYNSLRQAA